MFPRRPGIGTFDWTARAVDPRARVRPVRAPADQDGTCGVPSFVGGKRKRAAVVSRVMRVMPASPTGSVASSTVTSQRQCGTRPAGTRGGRWGNLDRPDAVTHAAWNESGAQGDVGNVNDVRHGERLRERVVRILAAWPASPRARTATACMTPTGPVSHARRREHRPSLHEGGR